MAAALSPLSRLALPALHHVRTPTSTASHNLAIFTLSVVESWRCTVVMSSNLSELYQFMSSSSLCCSIVMHLLRFFLSLNLRSLVGDRQFGFLHKVLEKPKVGSQKWVWICDCESESVTGLGFVVYEYFGCKNFCFVALD